MHQPVSFSLRAIGAAACVLFSCAVQAQTTLPAPMPAPAPAPLSTTTTVVTPTQNTPAPIVRQQHAEIAKGDPARWHQEDVTMAARMKTMRKEAAAALQENMGACRSMPAAERSACVREARSTYQQEMGAIGQTR